MNSGAANAKRILNVSSLEVTTMFAVLTVMVRGLNVSCPLVVLKVAEATRRLPHLQVAHPVQAAIVVLATENLPERQATGTFIYDRPANWASKEEKPIL
jgi:hypothetical protein